MLLDGKTAVVFGAGGQIGSRVARVFAREGASIHMSGPHREPVERFAAEIRESKGRAEAAEVDALKEDAVGEYLDRVASRSEKIDIVFNAMGTGTGEDVVAPSLEVPIERFLRYTTTVVASQFLTARVAARHMAQRRSGVVVFLGATPALGVAPFIAGASAAHAAIEGLTRCLATEWSPMGIRVVCVRPAGMTDTKRIQDVFGAMAKAAGAPKEALLQAAAEKALLRRMPTVPETAEIAAFLASDRASAITGAIINASCGEVLD